ncbi:outer membrane protein assembly factor BamD [Temperatibacter marinus]|uniref:Outer membrane protein assembly factor BamD n=1 Tax=Temperatibacter marinus TaxID=1456591 RepID=A0AA52H9S5_9PROT|nr:outer membrane protein assembly factor BamD [Temperatibacter marinus]WND02842.1 outer membrane protein assembly factor BamD [Temperatibacter marinus]
MSVKSVKSGIVALFVLTLAACSNSEVDDTYVARDVNVLYNLGKEYYEKGRYMFAAAAFDEVERQHPYSVWARRAQVMAAAAYYQAKRYDDAINAIDRFLQLHPGNSSAPYAYYIKALCFYEQIADVGRDQDYTMRARNAFVELIRRYPDSEYAYDAKQKLELTDDHLAGKEMEVGRYYMRSKEYLSAAIRFRNVIEKYQKSSHTPEALHRLVEVNLALGIQPEAQSAAAVLGYNYNGSKWYRYSYALLKNKKLSPEMSSGSWLSKLWPF